MTWRPDLALKYRHETVGEIKDSRYLYDPGLHTTSKPFRAYKGTTAGVVEVIIPSGSMIVVPVGHDSHTGKWRTDTLFVAHSGSIRAKSPNRVADAIRYYPWRLITTELNTNTRVVCTKGLHFCPSWMSAKRFALS